MSLVEVLKINHVTETARIEQNIWGYTAIYYIIHFHLLETIIFFNILQYMHLPCMAIY